MYIIVGMNDKFEKLIYCNGQPEWKPFDVNIPKTSLLLSKNAALLALKSIIEKNFGLFYDIVEVINNNTYVITCNKDGETLYFDETGFSKLISYFSDWESAFNALKSLDEESRPDNISIEKIIGYKIKEPEETEEETLEDEVTVTKFNVEVTDRGFKKIVFVDRYDKECSLQESSLATEAAIWFGANKIGLKRFEAGKGWTDIDDPDKFDIKLHYVANNRMHLTQDMVKQLLPYLQHFASTGDL